VAIRAIDHGIEVELSESYAGDGRLDHGYASTAYRAQGATVDVAFVLGSDELYREWATPRSRATETPPASTSPPLRPSSTKRRSR
jgi:hypothetical protein